jgi:AGCS family alanine or glycine:cation symporter
MWIILIIYLFIISVFLSIKLRFKNYKINIKELFKKDKTSLFLTLGTKIGVGSIIGTASCILIGGFSSTIWIILFSFLFTSLIYYESYYGNKYKKVNNSESVGGPYFIIRYGLNNKILSIISVILLILVYSFLFQMMQFNTISYILINKFYISKYIIIIVSLIILLITINLSIKDILNTLNKIVPYMCLLFVIVCLFIIIKNISNININIFLNNFLSFRSIFSGLVIGIKRSIFMNETLIGTTSTSSASDKNNINISIKYQILSSYFISIVVTLLITCLLLIYLSKYCLINDYNLLVYNIFNYTLGFVGPFFLIIIYILFGFTTVLSGYYIGKSNIEYLTDNKIILNTFKTLFILFSILGILFNSEIIWKYLDIFIFVMIIINSYSIIKLVMKYDRK